MGDAAKAMAGGTLPGLLDINIQRRIHRGAPAEQEINERIWAVVSWSAHTVYEMAVMREFNEEILGHE